jgi:5-formyltetrahydrofolate cyclo-ligase
MNKTELRKYALQKREQLSEMEREEMLSKLLAHFSEFDFSSIKIVHIYLPIKRKHEIDTFKLIDFLRAHKPSLIIVVPRSNFKILEMENVVYDEYTILEENKYGIYEPINGELIADEKIDMVICPLLAFDKRGYRVGYGKGFYDRFLSKCRGDVVKIGLSYFDPEEKIEDINDADVSLDYVISSSRIWKF